MQSHAQAEGLLKRALLAIRKLTTKPVCIGVLSRDASGTVVSLDTSNFSRRDSMMFADSVLAYAEEVYPFERDCACCVSDQQAMQSARQALAIGLTPSREAVH